MNDTEWYCTLIAFCIYTTGQSIVIAPMVIHNKQTDDAKIFFVMRVMDYKIKYFNDINHCLLRASDTNESNGQVLMYVITIASSQTESKAAHQLNIDNFYLH